MWNMYDVEEVRHVTGHVVFLRFEDGLAGELDLSKYIGFGPVFKPLANVEFFAQVFLEGGTIAWPNGADIAPERLYEELETLNKAARTRAAAR